MQRYPCEASQCPQDFRSACPEGWIQKDQTCLAPSINETIPSYCQQVPSDFVDSSPEVKAAFVKRCPNARFPCLQFTSDECIKDFHSCPLGFDQVHDHGCKPRVLQKTNCPNEINLMVMDSNQLEMLSKEYVKFVVYKMGSIGAVGSSLARIERCRVKDQTICSTLPIPYVEHARNLASAEIL
eukprot:Protomagalhaensia_wolfi_Nauph_80__4225@NODE_42_length_4330_cov_209_921697_g34_i0_p3_GENE_NODE_42_length_4330_cov_209_921697_g34_i0NODE_42_length_4330_cov_209_921697_g34_i0_p3_ORF_typecomplete_len183_score3_79CPW_WPC/PF09717_10/1e07CPW_WPC/PF09717_10/0_0002UL45/PF05473_12/0_0078CxC7/PF18866_1/35CxC7/PF18866_1/15_NODE_42_length_4330_cov_209_921697_g34_i05431091